MCAPPQMGNRLNLRMLVEHWPDLFYQLLVTQYNSRHNFILGVVTICHFVLRVVHLNLVLSLERSIGDSFCLSCRILTRIILLGWPVGILGDKINPPGSLLPRGVRICSLTITPTGIISPRLSLSWVTWTKISACYYSSVGTLSRVVVISTKLWQVVFGVVIWHHNRPSLWVKTVTTQ